MNNKVNAVLFDLDGTLLDTANDLGEALNYVLGQYDLPLVDREMYRPVASDGAKGLLELGFKERLPHFNYDELRVKFLTYYQHNLAKYTCLYSGVEQLLTALNNENIPWGVVTNKPEKLTQLLLPQFEQFNYCKVMVGGDTLPKRKPDPAPLHFACQQLNIKPEQCLYIGDAHRDIEAGNRANMTTIVAAWGYIKASDNIKDWHANHVANTPQECLMFTKPSS